MRSPNRPILIALLCGAALLSAIPALGQDNPKSLLPPGFGEPEAPPKEDPSETNKPTDLLPGVGLKPPSNTGGDNGAAPGTTSPIAGAAGDPSLNPLDPLAPGQEAELAIPVLQDLPPGARRSTANIGVIDEGDGGLGASAFGRSNGVYLSALMRSVRAPIASRWASILLRRALVSKVDTPYGVTGADWAAERAWLLVRMGEAESSRLLVQAVDIDQYTPKMFEVAMQASLANADPAGLCPMVESAIQVSKEPGWKAARAICSALAGESAQASAQIDSVRAKGLGRGIDGLLAEKVVGAGGNTRRAVVIEWDDVKSLTAWRYGMATATGLKIPDRLLSTVGLHVRAWQARAPLIPIADRTASADIAASLGVLSSAALVDHYGAWADGTDVSEGEGKPFTLLRSAYVAQTPAARLSAMEQLWSVQTNIEPLRYARLLLTARAAARLDPGAVTETSIDSLMASMFSAGLDVQASRWADIVKNASGDPALRAWALLAVGSPAKVVDWAPSRMRSYQSSARSESSRRGEFLFAAMAGLGRMTEDEAASMAEDLVIPIAAKTRWTLALERAVAADEPATVALLCAVGLQRSNFADIPAVQLYHVVSALRRVGMVNEARMIAAEALTRS